MKENLTNNNFLLFCFKKYDNPSAIDDKEFFEDISRIKYIKKLLTRYKTSGDLKERLILNHLIILSNVFDRDSLSKIIWLKMDDQLELIKPFMIALGILPEKVTNVNGKTYDTDDVPMDYKIIKILRGIKND